MHRMGLAEDDRVVMNLKIDQYKLFIWKTEKKEEQHGFRHL